MNDKGDDAVVDVYAVGFQEIVPLQVQKVLKVQDVERDAMDVGREDFEMFE